MEEGTRSIEVVWRAKKLIVEVDSRWKIEELGKKLVQLTNVNPDTLKLLVPQASGKGSRLLAPFSEDNSMLYVHEIGILKGKPIRMMGVFSDEINEVSQNNTKHGLRIAGFDEEDRRLRQLSTYKPQVLKLPQGSYIFVIFARLSFQGSRLLDPAPSKALRLMHMLACDTGIIAIMNKHRWRVGIMTELAPVGYVGISPKCILGFNKNHGEEISLRLRTDDLKGFRKYESIKKTLLHELAHMVFSEHDANFLALNKQLNEEASSLDWTKSNSHTLSGQEVDNVLETVSQSYKLGGGSNILHTARASSVAAAYNRSFSSPVTILASQTEKDSIKMYEVNNPLDYEKPVPTDVLMLESRSEMTKNVDEGFENRVSSSKSSMIDGVKANDLVILDNLCEEDILSIDEPESGNSLVGSILKTSNNSAKLELDENDSVMSINSGMGSEEPIPDDEGKEVLLVDGSKMQQNLSTSSYIELGKAEVISDDYINDSENIQLQRIEEPASAICAKLKESIDLLRSELTPQVVAAVLQTLSKIIRNIIEHPHELKFKRIRKANPQFQRNVANYKAAMEVLTMVGFIEDVVIDEVGIPETYLILKRNDPGLLWLAKSSIEVFIA
ncbi:hypothetical protein HPP92_018405 [Vanilla planifolia]|uniref:WLM domain-containing protein n=1 Tax=Vanilla planifolia TaxID=51239 RepID=A0A835UNB9_VANPL|nr:hypothetical protein HPP92_018405 [Vanilla planifolia]